MKKTSSVICMVGLVCSLLAGCTSDEGGSLKIPTVNIPGGNAETVDGTASQASGAGGENTSSGDADRWSDDLSDVSAYVIMQETQTDLGILQMPALNTALLNSQEAELAEAMFRDLEERVLADAKDVLAYYKEQGYDAPDPGTAKMSLSETKAALTGDVLSVLVAYPMLSETAPSTRFYEGINLDIKTGKTVPSMKLVEMAGYTEADLEYSVSCYCAFHKDILDYNDYYYKLADRQILPNPYEGVPQVYPLGDETALNSLTKTPEKTGKPWDVLERYPLTFYEGKGEVSVCAEIETPAGAGLEWNTIKLSYTYGGVVAGNPHFTHGNHIWRYPMDIDTAREAIYYFLSEEYLRLTMEEQRVDWIEIDGEISEICYVFEAHDYTDGQDVSFGNFAVGVFTGQVLHAGTEDGEWSLFNKVKTEYDTSFLRSNEAAGKVAVLLNGVDPFARWSLYPYVFENVALYGRDPETLAEVDLCNLYIAPKDEDSIFTLISGQYTEGIGFEEMSQVVSYPIEAGLGLYIEYVREEEARFAIRIENSAGSALYQLGTDADSEYGEVIYLEAER